MELLKEVDRYFVVLVLLKKVMCLGMLSKNYQVMIKVCAIKDSQDSCL
jgi:hypothetical protein